MKKILSGILATSIFLLLFMPMCVANPSRLLPDRCNFDAWARCRDFEIMQQDNQTIIAILTPDFGVDIMTFDWHVLTDVDLDCTPCFIKDRNHSGACGSSLDDEILNVPVLWKEGQNKTLQVDCNGTSGRFQAGDKIKLHIDYKYYPEMVESTYAKEGRGEVYATVHITEEQQKIRDRRLLNTALTFIIIFITISIAFCFLCVKMKWYPLLFSGGAFLLEILLLFGPMIASSYVVRQVIVIPGNLLLVMIISALLLPYALLISSFLHPYLKAHKRYFITASVLMLCLHLLVLTWYFGVFSPAM
jgi:hypothetical protein